MTLTQLRAFVAVARLGSVKEAAVSLHVSEPAVSSAVAALRRELGDPLFVRAGGGIALTPGGRRLAAGAAEIVGLAEETRRSVREAGTGSSYLRVATTETSAEQIVPPLLEAFVRRQPEVDVATLAVPAGLLTELLLDRRADVAIGTATGAASGTIGGTATGMPGGTASGGTGADDQVERVPFLRVRLVVVASPARFGAMPGRPFTARPHLPASRLRREHWLLGPSGLDPDTPAGALLARNGVGDHATSVFPSAAAALNAVAAGDGLTVTLLHLVRDELRQGKLTVLDVPGTPVDGVLYAAALRGARRSQAAGALCRFVTTPGALQSLLTRASGVPVNHFHPTVHITLWS